MFEYRDVLRFSSNTAHCVSAMKNIRRYLTQEITEERIQNVLDMDIFDIMANCLNNSDNDTLKVKFIAHIKGQKRLFNMTRL